MRALRSWHGLLGTLALAGLGAPAAAQPVGSEFQINTYTRGNQRSPAVAADTSGNFVVVWESDTSQDGNFNGVFGQRYDHDGRALGSEFQVNSYTTGNQHDASVAADASGNFAVIWRGDLPGDLDGDIFGQRYDSAGNMLGAEFRVNSNTGGAQQRPSVASDASGAFVVVWQSVFGDGDGWGVFGQRYDSAGMPQGGEFQVNTYTGWHQWYASVDSDASGNFVVSWQSLLPGGSGYQIVAQRYDSGGMALGAEFRVTANRTGIQPSVASDASGNFVVVWRSSNIFGQRYDSAGHPLGGEFQVNTYTTGGEYNLSVSSDASGNFVVTWDDGYFGNQDGSDSGVFGQRYDSTGARPRGASSRSTRSRPAFRSTPLCGPRVPTSSSWPGIRRTRMEASSVSSASASTLPAMRLRSKTPTPT